MRFLYRYLPKITVIGGLFFIRVDWRSPAVCPVVVYGRLTGFVPDWFLRIPNEEGAVRGNGGDTGSAQGEPFRPLAVSLNPVSRHLWIVRFLYRYPSKGNGN